MRKAALSIAVVGIVVSVFAAGCASDSDAPGGAPRVRDEYPLEERQGKETTDVVPLETEESAPEQEPEEEPEEEPMATEEPVAAEEPAEAEPRVLDDFEGQIQWKPVDWKNSNPARVSSVQTDGNNGLLIRTGAGEQDKAAIARAMDPGIDMTGYEKLNLEVNLRGEKPIAMSVALTTGAFYEAPAQELEPGMNEISFDLTASEFKTTPHWEPNEELKGRHFVKEIFLILYTSEAREAVVDNIRLEE